MLGIFRGLKTFFNFIFRVRNGFLVIIDRFGLLKTKRPYLIKLRNGLNFYIHHWGAAGPINSIIFCNEYELPRKKMDKDEIYVDIGAHIGAFSVFAASLNKKRKIYSFEPEEYNFSILKKNIAINKLKNIKVFNQAVSEKSGYVWFSVSDELGSQGHSIFRDFRKKVKVKSTSLKDIFTSNRIKKCDFLKIDCEGAEYSMLFSTPKQLFKRIDKVFIEYHKSQKYNYKDIIRFFKDIGGFRMKIDKFSKNKGYIIFTKSK